MISLVTEEIAQQVSLASCEFDSNVNEFEKAGLTEVKSECILPPRVMESQLTLNVKDANNIFRNKWWCRKPSNM